MDQCDINQKNSLLKTLKDIDTSKQISIKISNTVVSQIILKTSSLPRRVDEKCEVYCYIQRYLSTKSDQSLLLINKDYINVLKKNPSSMKSEELILRECLLKLFDEQKAIFIIPKKICLAQYDRDLKLLKIPKEAEDKYKDCLYYKIEVESIIYNYPNEPSLTPSSHYITYIKKFQEEVRYLLTKRHYTPAEKWSNTIITKVIGMSNALKATLSDKVKKEFYQLMKPIVMNKVLSLTLKDGDEKSKRDGYEKAIKCIENDYYKNYPNDYDDSYVKMTGRYAMFCIKLKDFSKARSKVEELKSNCASENSLKVVKEIENELNQGSTQKKVKRTQKRLFNALASFSDDYEWDLGSRDISEYLNPKLIDNGVSHVLQTRV